MGHRIRQVTFPSIMGFPGCQPLSFRILRLVQPSAEFAGRTRQDADMDGGGTPGIPWRAIHE
jgi:hypothetical protein